MLNVPTCEARRADEEGRDQSVQAGFSGACEGVFPATFVRFVIRAPHECKLSDASDGAKHLEEGRLWLAPSGRPPGSSGRLSLRAASVITLRDRNVSLHALPRVN